MVNSWPHFFSQYIPFSCLPYCTVITISHQQYADDILLYPSLHHPLRLATIFWHTAPRPMFVYSLSLSLILMVFNKQPLISHSTLRNQTPYFSLLASACTYLSFWYTCWFAGCNIPAAVAQDSYCTKENFELKFRIKITMHVMPSKLDSMLYDE